MKITSNIPERRLKLMLSLFLILPILAAYGRVMQFDFVSFDDTVYVSENKQVQEGINRKSLIWAVRSTQGANWHPLTWLSHMLDYELYGLNPMGHHWTNLQLHIANSVLLFLILQAMTGALWRSAFVAALFAVHPLHVESVAWISERKDVLSTFFGLLMIFAYSRYVKKPGCWKYLWVTILFILGLLAKPMLVTFPFILLLLDFWPLKRFQHSDIHGAEEGKDRSTFQKKSWLFLEKIPFFILSTVFSIVTYKVQRSVGAITSLGDLPLQVRMENALVSYLKYVGKMFWPHKLSIFYPYPWNSLPTWEVIGAALVIILAVIFSLHVSEQYPYLLFGLFWYLGTLVPVIGLVQAGDQAMADRYTYIPLIGLFIVVTWGVSDLIHNREHHKTFIVVTSALIISLLTMRTYFQVSHWKNSIELFENAVRVTENNALAHNSLGAALFSDGKFDKAFFHFAEAVKIDPDYARAHNNLAVMLSDQGKLDKAAVHYQTALKLMPGFAEAHYNFGILLLRQNNMEEAYRYFAETIKINPNYSKAYRQIGAILAGKGKFKEAETFFQKALQMNSNLSTGRKNNKNLKQVFSEREK